MGSILQGEWDECNGVEFVDHDIDALKLAAELCNAEYCEVGNDCKFVLMSDFSATDIEAIAVQMANSYNHEVEYGSKGFWQSVVKVA